MDPLSSRLVDYRIYFWYLRVSRKWSLADITPLGYVYKLGYLKDDQACVLPFTHYRHWYRQLLCKLTATS